jgi:hypothetical protein
LRFVTGLMQVRLLPETAYLIPHLRSVLVWIRKPFMTARE